MDQHLLESGSEQPELFPAEAIEQRMLRYERERGEYTLEHLEARAPAKLTLIIHLLAAGYGRLRIAELASCSHHTVRAVADAQAHAVAMEKERMASAARHGAGMLIEGVLEDVADPDRRRKISTRDKAISAGVLIDKALLLAGDANVIIRDERPEFTHEDMERYLADLPRTGTSGEKPGQKGGPPLAVDAGPADPAAGQVDLEAAAPTPEPPVARGETEGETA